MKYIEEQESEMKRLREEMKEWYTNKYKRRFSVRETREYLKRIASERYPSLTTMNWSNGWICDLRDRNGITKKKYKTIGSDKKIKTWIEKQITLWGKVKAINVKKTYKSMNGKKLSRGGARRIRNEMKLKTVNNGLGIGTK